jgi:hypothetical protein
VRYSPKAELWYPPIGFRWAHNFEPHDATETRGFLNYDKKSPANTVIVLAHAEMTR